MVLRSRLAYWLSAEDPDVYFCDVIIVTKLSVRVNGHKSSPNWLSDRARRAKDHLPLLKFEIFGLRVR